MRRSILALTVLALAGCANEPNYLGRCEATLGLDGAPYPEMHKVVHYPGGLGFNFPGYLVGFEKAPREGVSRSGDVGRYVRVPAARQGDDGAAKLEDIVDRLNGQPKLILPTHVIGFGLSKEGRFGIAADTIYSAYPKVMEAADCVADGSGLTRGMDALRTTLKDRIVADLAKARPAYTHILVMSQGWNTTQEESIRNFNSMVTHLVEAAEPGFRPLVVGLSWPSLWDVPIEFFSYFNKANDADEAGLLGVNLLVNDTLAAAKASQPGLKVVAVGHSFGARLMSRAVFSGAYLAGAAPAKAPVVDLFVGLQGAVSINRFRPKHSLEGAPYRKIDTVGAVVMTASRNDEVNGVAFWSDHAGDIGSYLGVCGPDAVADPDFVCMSADKTGAWPGGRPGKVAYVDATALISVNASGTGGKAHSDIYRKEHGVFLWNAIKAISR